MKPKLRFKEFSDEWEEKKLGDIARLINGRAYKQNELLNEGKYFVLRVGNLFTNPEKYYSNLELEDDKYINDGDLIYAWSATFGPRIWKGTRVIYHYHIWKLQLLKNDNKEFIYQLLLNDTHKIEQQKTGGTLTHITKANMEMRQLPLPSLPEQEKIGQFLSLVDKRIEKQEQRIELLKERKKGWMQKIFNQEIRFKDENGNDYPDWEAKKLGDIAKISRGLTYKPKDICDSGIRVLRSSNILENHFIILDDIFVDDKSVSINLINKNDIIITAANGSLSLVGKHAIINSVNEKMVHGGFMLKCESPSNLFINQWMNTDEYNRQIYQSIQGGNGALGNISKVQLELFTINLPSFPEQEKIAGFLSKQDELIEQEEKKLELLKEQKKGLLQQMFV